MTRVPGVPVTTDASPAAVEPGRPGSVAILVLLLVMTLATRLIFTFAIPWCAEDAYITFRYAAHWAQGLGPVYNAGEKAWGFTSPLWTSMLALMAFAGAPIEQAARVTLVGCDLLSLVLAWRLLERHSRLAATAFGLFFACWPRLAQLPATGLETSLVTCLLLAAASLAATRGGGALNGLLALSRPEGAAMSVLLGWRLQRRQRLVWLAVAALLGGFMLYFGQWFPSSVGSKATVYGIQWFKGLYWLEWLIPGLPPQTADGEALAPIAALFAAGLIAILAQWRHSPPRESPLPVLLGCGLATLLGYLLLGVPWSFWYAPTPMVAILLAVFTGLASAGGLRWTLVPFVIFLLFAWGSVAPRVVRLQTHDAAIFMGLGQTLREDAAGRPSSVMLEPIGIIGYVSGMRVVDEVGLVTPWVAREREQGDGWYARVLQRDRPDYVVIRRDWLAGGVSWAGAGAPFVSQQQADSALTDYEVLRLRAGQGLPEGAARLLILRRRR
jgi:hypothetical protein